MGYNKQKKGNHNHSKLGVFLFTPPALEVDSLDFTMFLLVHKPAHTHVPSIEDVARKVEVHLVAWQHLAHRCTELGLLLYKLRPKHHYFDHLGRDIARTLLNPRKVHQCNNDESFLGYLKRIGVRCHQANIMHRLFQRYLLFLSIRWHDTSCEDNWKQHTRGKSWERCCLQTACAGRELGSTRAQKPWCLWFGFHRFALQKNYVVDIF